MVLSIETPSDDSTSEPFICVLSLITHIYMAYHLELIDGVPSQASVSSECQVHT